VLTEIYGVSMLVTSALMMKCRYLHIGPDSINTQERKLNIIGDMTSNFDWGVLAKCVCVCV
jgi:hypothetical protein